jgi:hypothetical protein
MGTQVSATGRDGSSAFFRILDQRPTGLGVEVEDRDFEPLFGGGAS